MSSPPSELARPSEPPFLPEYLATVERVFLNTIGRGLMLSPRDIELVTCWARAGIPVDVVAAAVTDALSNRPRVRSLSYCKAAVERAFKSHQQRMVGGGGQRVVPPSAGISEALGELAESFLAASDFPQVKALAGELKALAIRARRGETEGAILALDELADRFGEVLLSSLTQEARQQVQAEVERGAASSPPSERAVVERALRWRAVRTHLELPQLSLKL